MSQASGSWVIPHQDPVFWGHKGSLSVPDIKASGDPPPRTCFFRDPRGSPHHNSLFWGPKGSLGVPRIRIPGDPPPQPTFWGPKGFLSVPSIGIPGDPPPQPTFWGSQGIPECPRHRSPRRSSLQDPLFQGSQGMSPSKLTFRDPPAHPHHLGDNLHVLPVPSHIPGKGDKPQVISSRLSPSLTPPAQGIPPAPEG